MLRASCLVLACTALPGAAIAQTEPAPSPPNIVLVLADDLGFGDPRCFNAESKIATPHIDALAAAGARFVDAHTPTSVCTPTRYGILTGRYAWRTGLQRGVLWPWDPPLLEDERRTLPELFAERGYRTCCVGKWHLGWNWPLRDGRHVRDLFAGVSMPAARRAELAAQIDFAAAVPGGPLAHGFQHYFGDDVPNFPPYAFLRDDRLTALPTAHKGPELFGHDGAMVPGWDLSAVLPAITQHAATWIDEHARRHRGRPFFLYFALTSPHTPIAPSSRWAGSSEAGTYGDWVAETDWALGEVLAALARNDLERDTIVVFTSDNGSPQRDGTGHAGPVGSVPRRFEHDPSRPWRGLKSDAWEGGHRVPFVVRWPGAVGAGRVADDAFCLTDLYRTLATAAGAEVPRDAGEDSFDFLPVWRGEPRAAPVRDHLVHHSGNGVFAIRTGRWKLILGKGSGGFSQWQPPADAPPGQLYDLAADPGERDNVYREHPDVVAQLTHRLADLRARGRSTE